jgi:hypothetical protein
MKFLNNLSLPGVGKPGATPQDPLGPLAQLLGTWVGTGFNQIWRPFNVPPQDRFLELNQTTENLKFDEVPGDIPNRGLLQADINLRGLRYLQQVQDAVVKGANGDPAGLHVEPGLWLTVPDTTDPAEPGTVARLGTIPHGTSILAQGTAKTTPGAPSFDKADITPFFIGQPGNLVPFPESNLGAPSQFRTPAGDIPGVTQAMVNDPNSVLAAAIAGQTIVSTTTLTISTATQQVRPPDTGGGTSNIAFLDGAGGKPNASAAQVDAIFWIEQVKRANGAIGLQLQYSQRVLLNFNGLSWPHFSVATLKKK